MGIYVVCKERSYSESYSGFMTLRRIAGSATLLYLLDLAGKQPAERARYVLSVEGIDDPEDLDTFTMEAIEGGLAATTTMFKNERVDDGAAGEMMWRRHQIFANLGLSGLVDLVFHSDSDGYYTAGMAADILAWWTRVGPFYEQAVGKFVREMPSESDMQESMDLIAKRFCSGVRVVVQMNKPDDVQTRRVTCMNCLLAVFREVVETGTHARVC